MAVAHSAASESHTGTTGSTNQTAFSWTHTQTGTPQGVLVFVHTISASNFITSVTYGGLALDRVAGAVAIDTATEPGRTDLFFLGAGLATGNQTIAVNRTNNGTIMYASAATVTAATDTTLTGTQIRQENQAPAEVAITDLSRGTNSVRYAAAYYGGAAPAPAGASSTLLTSIDLGAFGNSMVRETTAGQGSRNVGFSAASDDYAAVFTAVVETKVFSTTGDRGDFRLTERNSFDWSDDYTDKGAQAGWTNLNTTITTNAIAAPDGSDRASLLLETTVNGEHRLYNFIEFRTNKVYTISGYCKAYVGAATRRVRLNLGPTTPWGSNVFAIADLVAGTITSTGGTPSASGITAEGDGWYRIYLSKEYTGENTVGGYAVGPQLISGTTTSSYTGNTNAGAYVWGFQYEEGPLSEYDPTYGYAAGRDGEPRSTDLKVGWAVSAETGVFNLTGNAADLAKGGPATIAPVAGVFILDGKNAATRHNVRIEAEAGAFSLAGNAATLAKGKSIAADKGQFTLAGNPADTRYNVRIAGGTGAFSFAGNPATFTKATPKAIAADRGQFTLTGNAATLRQNYRLTAETGTFTATGQPATLLHNPRIEAATGSFALTGGTPVVLHGRYLSGGSGTFIETGQPATFRRTWAIRPTAGAFGLTGNAAALTEIGAYEIDPILGTFALTGQPAQLAQSQSLLVDAGTFALTGQLATLRHSYALAAESGAFAVTGNVAALRHNQRLSADTSTFALTGGSTSIAHGYALSADTGTFAVTGNPATFARTRAIGAATGTFTLTVNPAALTEVGAYEIAAATGSFALTGNAAALAKASALGLAADTGTFALTGNQVTVRAARSITAAAGAFTLTGNAVNLVKAEVSELMTDAGTYALTGANASLAKSGTTRRRNVLIF